MYILNQVQMILKIELKIYLFQLYNQPNPVQRHVGQIPTSLQGDFKLPGQKNSSFFQVLIKILT